MMKTTLPKVILSKQDWMQPSIVLFKTDRERMKRHFILKTPKVNISKLDIESCKEKTKHKEIKSSKREMGDNDCNVLVVKLKLVKKDKENMTFLKRVPNSEVVKKCDVRVLRLDRNHLGIRNCEIRMKRMDWRNFRGLKKCNVRIMRIQKSSEDEEIVENFGNKKMSTALVPDETSTNEIYEENPEDDDIEEVPRNDDDDIEEIPRNDDDVIIIRSFSVTITRKISKL